MKHKLSPRRRFFCALVLTLFSASLQLPIAHAAALTQQRAAAPAPQQSRAVAAAPAQQTPLVSRTLANGLEVIVLEDHSIPLINLELAVKNGSYTEPPELNGLSHLYEHMFFKANRAVLEGAEYIKVFDQLGILWNASTREEIVNYYFHTTSPNLRVTMNFMRDAVRYPLFDERQFEQERQAVLAEMDRHEAEPGHYLNEEMTDRLFYKYPSRKKPGGNRATVKAATTDTMRLIQKRYYVPNNSALIVTGDAEPETIFKLAQEFLGDWPRAEDPFVKYPIVEHPPLPKSEGVLVKQPINNIILEIGWHGPSIGKDNPATYAADVFSFILLQPDSRFKRALVDTGLVTGVDFNYYTQRNVGPIRIFAQTTPEKAKAALKAIYAEVARFNDPDYFTDEQLENAKGLLEAQDLYEREKLSDYTHTIGFWWSSTGLEYFRGYLQNLRRTSRADINRYVSTYIQGQPHVGLALLSEATQQQAQLTPQDLTGETTGGAASSKQ
ncbi:MAG: insulinase family protein [Pyrinomonadaceae bacterium]|nr:insulinase family protein [Pyrinomonadaceae bacterium]MDQ3133672.1 insulinase family protein [Acidobacteriota bacterium]